MPTLNRVMLMGNLTRDPQIRETKSGIPVGDIGLAVNEKFKDRSGQLKERTCFVDIVVWDKLATLCQTRLHKGSPIFVEGRLEMDEWTDAEGKNRTRLRVRCDQMVFLDSRPRDGEAAGGPDSASRPRGDAPAAPAGDDEPQPF
jgi:single-strand DNA-binding protein